MEFLILDFESHYKFDAHCMCTVLILSNSNMFFFVLEPNGREQSIVQNNHHISMVPTLLGHSLSEQERSSRREDYVFASGRLLPWIRW